jgi:hypothetical protein
MMHDIPNKMPAQAIVHLVSKPKAILGSIIKIPAPKPKELPYENIPCSERDKACVREIITSMGENGKFSLLFMQGHLRDLGAEIEQLHPLKFLSSIFVHPELKVHMAEIFDDYFKRTGFMDGLGPNLSLEADKGRLDQYLDAFAKEINFPAEKIRPYFDNRDWEEMVRTIIRE